MVGKLVGPEKTWSRGVPMVALTILDATPLQTETQVETGIPVASDCAHWRGVETLTKAATQRSGQMFVQAHMQRGLVLRPASVLSWPIVLLVHLQVEHRALAQATRSYAIGAAPTLQGLKA